MCRAKPNEWRSMGPKEREEHSLSKADFLESVQTRDKLICPLFNLPGISNYIMHPDWMHSMDEGFSQLVPGQILFELLPHYPGRKIRSLWLKLPSRLKILVKNGTSVLSIHLDQVSARSVGWPLVYFFLLNCPVTCCLDPFFHLQNFSIYYPFFNIIGPACHCGRSRLFPSSTFPTPFSLHSIGPACHCGRSRLFLSSTFPTPISLHPIGPACHCGRSRLSLSSTFSTPPPFLYLIGPACHCGRSRLFPSSTFPTPISPHPIGPACHCGRSRLSLSSTFPTPISPHPIGPACHCGRSRLFPSSSFSTPPPFLYLIGPACHCGRSRLFSLPLLFPPPFFIYPFPLPLIGPACHCGRSRQFPDFPSCS